MKKILGLDVGTNSVGWAVVEHDFEEKSGKILGMGSRVIPMDQAMISDFNNGNLQSSTSLRTGFRGVRRLRERQLNRRKRLIEALKILGFIPPDFLVNPNHSIAYRKLNGKNEFKFIKSYEEMKNEFSKNSHKSSIPHDWTIYYLRNKALREKISKEELAWVVLQFNTKRGYYQLRGDVSLNTKAEKSFVSDIVDSIIDTQEKSRGNKIFRIELRSGISGLYTDKQEPEWLQKRIDFIVTETKLKNGEAKVTMSVPNEDDWTLRKKRTEKNIQDSGKTIGQYIYHLLLENPTIKIRGKEVHTIDRILYKNELEAILAKQQEFHPELTDQSLFEKAANVLYKNNKSHRENLLNTSIAHLIVEDIIFYQRPLKSKKYLISDCKFESYWFKDKNEIKSRPIKVTAKSHPLFQEFRIWSLIHNLRIYQKEYRDENGILHFDQDVSKSYLDMESKAKLFELFNVRKEVSHKQILKQIGIKHDLFSINYEEGLKLKGNETKATFLTAIKGVKNEAECAQLFENSEFIEKLWHIFYSLIESEENVKTALERLGLEDEFVKALLNVKPYSKDYASFSRKALRKLVPLMRTGKYWDKNQIDKKTLGRINNLLTGEFDDSIRDKVRTLAIEFSSLESFQGLPEWLASYVVYDRHSEVIDTKQYTSPSDIDVSKLVKQHSLRNPVVEKILRETLLIVRDAWRAYGKPDEIHVELARELKLPNDKRKKLTQKRNENTLTNKRARIMLHALSKEYSNVNPFSSGQLELFKLYEEGALSQLHEGGDEDIKLIRRKGDPSQSEIQKYRLWLEQKYISPYTGSPISLSALFSSNYEIEHVIPKSKYYDNSFRNKIICERSANRLKDNRTAYQFICEMGGKKLSDGKTVLGKDAYEKLVLKMYKGKSGKIKNLLSLEVPKSFNSTQLNNTRYISKKLLSLLDPVVRDEHDRDVISRHLISMAGGITHILRHDWGLHDIWKQILAPRFIRMNALYDTDEFYNKIGNRIDLSGNDTELKRLDHRHHAVDALVIACTSRQHIQYINSYQNEKIRYGLKPKLFNKNNMSVYEKSYQKPWLAFPAEAKKKLDSVITSFKHTHRVINRTKNYYQKYVEKDGIMVKQYIQQQKSENFWSIRQAFHKDTIQGKRTVREYKSISINNAIKCIQDIADKSIKNELTKRLEQVKGDIKVLLKGIKKEPLVRNGKPVKNVKLIVYNSDKASSRTMLDETFNVKKIEKVLGGNTKSILLEHLASHEGDSSLAFSPHGLMEMNKNLKTPIYKVTTIEELGKKFPLAEEGEKSNKFVETAKGNNLFFLIYIKNEDGSHLITKDSTLSFGEVMFKMKNQIPLAEEKEGYSYFFLSPGDLVYVSEDLSNRNLPEDLNIDNVYKCVSFSKRDCFFIPANSGGPLLDKKEYSSSNKREKSISGIMIKSQCIKLEVDRLGRFKR